ncbi:MAG TPA: hypothetical protein VIV11_15345 [Kofleriaceae bacterium]
MRPDITCSAVLLLSACATSADPAPPYDEVARILGAEVATANGGSVAAIADIANLAHGGLPDGFFRGAWGHIRGSHDGIEYTYVVWCRDTRGKPATCGEWTDSAHAIAGWGGTMQTARGALTVWHQGVWDLDGLHGGLGLARAQGWSVYGLDGSLYVKSEAQLVVDFGAAKVVGGAFQITNDVFDPDDGALLNTLPGEVVFDRAERPTIVLDDHRYWLDMATGEVTAATVLE